MDDYRKVPKQKTEQIQPNEIRITSQGKSRRYISYAVALLDPSLVKQFQEESAADTENAENLQTPQQQYDTVILKAIGRAINKTVTIAEVVKRRVAGLHQITLVHSTDIVDEYEPLVEGLKKKEVTRTVSAITITLSKKQLDKNDPGYQEPLPLDQVQPLQPIPHYEDEERPPRRRHGRGRRASDQGDQQREPAVGDDQNQEEGEPRRRRRPRRNRRGRRTGGETGGEGGGEQSEQPQQQQQGGDQQQQRAPRQRRPRQRNPQDQQGDDNQDFQGGAGEQGERARTRGRGRGRRGRGRGRGRGGEGGEGGGNAQPSDVNA